MENHDSSDRILKGPSLRAHLEAGTSWTFAQKHARLLLLAPLLGACI